MDAGGDENMVAFMSCSHGASDRRSSKREWSQPTASILPQVFLASYKSYWLESNQIVRRSSSTATCIHISHHAGHNLLLNMKLVL